MMGTEAMFLIAGIAVVVYLLLLNRLSAVIQPLRFEVAEIGEELLADANVPEHRKKRIRLWLNGIFSVKLSIAVALSVFPAGISSILADLAIRRRIWRQPVQEIGRQEPLEGTAHKYNRLRRLLLICSLGNSPLVALLIVVQAFLVVMLFVPIGIFTRSTFEISSRIAELLDHSSERPEPEPVGS